MLFTAGGIATPADAAMMMQLGAEGVFVGSGIFKSGDPAKRAAAIVKATTFYDDPDVIAKVSRGLGEAMVGINVDDAPRARPLRQPRLVTAHEQLEPSSACWPCRATYASTWRRSKRSVRMAIPVAGPTELAGVDGLVLPGGESTTIVKLAVPRSTCWSRCERRSPTGCRRTAPAPA